MAQQFEEEKVPFKAFVGIDFGTDGSGLAYCLPDGTAYIHNMWGATEPTEKPKTSVLFDNDNEVLSVGSKAQDMYIESLRDGWKLFERFKMNLYEEPASKSELKPAESKMDFVDLKDKIASSNDSGITEDSSKVFIAQLKWLKKHAFDFIENHLRNKLKLKGDKEKGYPEIQYYLTVPAIWSDRAKDKMTKWTQKAGLINGKIPNQLKIVYEPDCASLSIQHAIIRYMKGGNNNNKNANDYDSDVSEDEDELSALQPTVNINVELKPGDKYILIDTGGGTCDVACHEILNKFKIAEVLHPSGGKWGATYIDERFITLLCELFTSKLLNIFQMVEERGRTSYLSFLSHFLNESKLSFYENSEAEYHDIQMPSTFVEFVANQYNKEFDEGNDSLDVATILQKLNQRLHTKGRVYKKVAPSANNNNNVSNPTDDDEGDNQQNDKKPSRDWMIKIIKNKGYVKKKEEKYLLSIHADIWEMMFNTVTNPIIKHCKKILTINEMKNAKYIFLVGGFSKSKYFQMRMKSEFSKYKNVSVISPDLPDLCVVDGAARYGLDPNFVRIRRLAKTYGIKSNLPTSWLDLEKFPHGYVEKHTYPSYRQKTKQFNCDMVENCFNVIVRKGEAVSIDGKPMTKTVYKMTEAQKDTAIEIYSSTEQDPTIIKEKDRMSYIQVDLPKHKDDGTVVEFRFTSNLLTVFAYPTGQRHKMKQCQVEYY